MMDSLKKKYNSKQENFLNKLLDLQNQIKRESTTKELCNSFFYFNFL